MKPTLPGGREWLNKWNTGPERVLDSGDRDPYDAEFIVRGDGQVFINGAGIATMSGTAPRMYVYDEARAKKWNNVEVTFYGRRVSEMPFPTSYRGFVCGTRSEHQDAANTASGILSPCKGRTYYGKLLYDGRVLFQKEIQHNSDNGYSLNVPNDEKLYWNTPDRSLPVGEWVGYKLIVQTVNNGRNVWLRLYRDVTDGRDGGDWQLLIQYIDQGGWTNPDLTLSLLRAACPNDAPSAVDEVLLGPGTSTFIRNDNILAADYKKFSIREIAPAD
ncbi:MAG: hypothetical protein AB1585_08195 [Thermodesulfobacteriota bacterium]